MTRYVHLFGENPVFVKFMRTWGKAGTVKVKIVATPKLANHGVQCMFVGYATNHDEDCYWMLNVETMHVLITSDVIWLKRMHFPPATVTEEPTVKLIENNNVEVIKAGKRAGKGNFDGDNGANNPTRVDNESNNAAEANNG